MTPTFDDYEPAIRSLPSDATLADVANDRFLLARDGLLEAFYAPLHGVTSTADVVIIGLTPGRSQMVRAFCEAKKLLHEGWRPPLLFGEVRRRMAFAGPMRTNLVHMLDKIGLADHLGLQTTAKLFDSASAQLHSTSVLRYPVLKDGADYKGSPKVSASQLLTGMAQANLTVELERLDNAFVIPLGRAVEDALAHLGFRRSTRILWGFPHPSGGNGHRVKQFNREYRSLRRVVRAW
ncbi:MAG: hypothetical protein OXH09_13285 [Gammaproteobacteria bacterium]|nr:hypothetical protein [Gammaproteobacteria bacterium]